ncbi:MAG TPA: GNAT family N-acetyltransferase [Gemmatimonadaceae bacterium]|nr:GNAT family N-acetyltransferase [Gemmatimonadaceae bacterium]
MEVVRTYLELETPSAFKPAAAMASDARVLRRDPCPVADYRRLYAAVGGPWHWRDRLAWDDATLQAHLASPDIAIWELVVGDESAGYFELRRSGDQEIELAYFGLAPRFIGRGLGGALLTRAVEEAWKLGARRVWLHTCTLDSPHALPNYRARGFRDYRTERYEVDVAPAPGRA